MISLESKTTTSAPSSPLSLAPQEEAGEGTLSFSELLRGAGIKKDDKVIQNGALILALDEEPSTEAKVLKPNSLLELLKGESKEDSKLPLELNPELTKNLTPTELKVLIKNAKEYLKNKIIASEGFKKVEIEALPKTLKGLVQVANKLGIDVSKITFQEVKASVTVLSKPIQKTLQSTVADKEASADTKVKVQAQTQESVDVDSEIVVKKVSKNGPIIQKTVDTLDKQVDEKLNQQVKSDVKTEQLVKEIKSTPLFKAQGAKEITTEQLVNTKINTLETNVGKKKTDETLKLLLRGDKAVKNQSGFTADFSVATARVLAPEATTNASKALESLLKGESPDNQQSLKTDGLAVAKADSFEIKLSEAKQMTKYLSSDVKTAIEDYKSPFTKVKVDLNPQRLGSVELTVVQRGKNLHISLSSNNAAINALALNANDLKVQLSNNGINNASLNFNNNSESSGQSAFGQQQNSHQREEAQKEYNYLQGDETNEEIVSSLEIVVPHYA